MSGLAEAAVDDNRLVIAQSLRDALRAIECNDEPGLKQAVVALERHFSRPLCRTLAVVQSELTSALSAVPFDDRLSQLAGHDMPDAATRLDYVVGLTESAAHTTLDLADELRAEVLALAAEGVAVARVANMRRLLTDLQQAQAYQDLTGQVIRHVVSVIQRAETALCAALNAAGIQPAAASARRAPETRILSGVDRGAANQSDADELLAGLGL